MHKRAGLFVVDAALADGGVDGGLQAVDQLTAVELDVMQHFVDRVAFDDVLDDDLPIVVQADVRRIGVAKQVMEVAEDFLKAHPGIICAPLWIRDEVTGFLYLDSTRRSAEQGSEDQSFLVAFSQQVALGLEADVWVIDRNTEALRRLWAQFGPALNTVFSTRDAIEKHVAAADLVIGGVLVPGASAPKLVSRQLIGRMERGSVVVDVAIDQGGCFETSRATTHADPVFAVDGVIHYCVANMPGGVPRTSTYALNNATLPFVLALADKGWKQALADDAHLRAGLNVAMGKVTCRPVAEAQGYPFVEAAALVA